jgi:MFS family permease
MAQKEYDELLVKYRQKLNKELGVDNANINTDTPINPEVISKEYIQFKNELLPNNLSFYEKACQFSEKILKIAPDKKKLPDIEESIRITHLNITPAGVFSFSLLGPLTYILIGILLSMLIPAILGAGISTFFMLFFIITGLIMIFPLQALPGMIANNWRMNASNQMVLCIFYVVTYMRHTSNLERAIEFAAHHLSGPLALDLKKVLWDVETEQFSSIKESLDNYLETWKKWNLEFVESFHLIESSLYESDDARRVSLLDKSLDVILTETYEKMLHYARNLKSPITTLHMLGIILPILGLVILPLVVSFIDGVRWYHLAAFYNVGLPVLVYLLGKSVLAKRPTGYGAVDISEDHPELKKLKKININFFGTELLFSPAILGVTVALILLFLAIIPPALHFVGFPDIGFGDESVVSSCGFNYCLLDYRENVNTGALIGPFSLIAAIFSFCIPLALGLGLGIYYKLKSKNVIAIRERAKKLEKEFASGLFQLGNRLGDGIPAEIAFAKVADVMAGTTTGQFFEHVHSNISRMGMSINDALFNPKTGACVYFPSKMIQSSMKVLTESVKKGPKIAAQALINISRYIKEMHRVDERLKDLLSEVISSMKSQINMMTPVIAGIVIGITSMITNILGNLAPLLQSQTTDGASAVPTDLFGLGIPTYFFQGVVGLYVAQLIFILTILSNGIENGSDKLNEEFLLGKNMLRSVLMYVGIALVVMVIFNTIADLVLADVM